MNAPTIIICVVLAGLFALAIWRMVKKGTCDCGEKQCGGSCPHCSHCGESDKKAKHS